MSAATREEPEGGRTEKGSEQESIAYTCQEVKQATGFDIVLHRSSILAFGYFPLNITMQLFCLGCGLLIGNMERYAKRVPVDGVGKVVSGIQCAIANHKETKPHKEYDRNSFTMQEKHDRDLKTLLDDALKVDDRAKLFPSNPNDAGLAQYVKFIPTPLMCAVTVSLFEGNWKARGATILYKPGMVCSICYNLLHSSGKCADLAHITAPHKKIQTIEVRYNSTYERYILVDDKNGIERIFQARAQVAIAARNDALRSNPVISAQAHALVCNGGDPVVEADELMLVSTGLEQPRTLLKTRDSVLPYNAKKKLVIDGYAGLGRMSYGFLRERYKVDDVLMTRQGRTQPTVYAWRSSLGNGFVTEPTPSHERYAMLAEAFDPSLHRAHSLLQRAAVIVLDFGTNMMCTLDGSSSSHIYSSMLGKEGSRNSVPQPVSLRTRKAYGFILARWVYQLAAHSEYSLFTKLQEAMVQAESSVDDVAAVDFIAEVICNFLVAVRRSHENVLPELLEPLLYRHQSMKNQHRESESIASAQNEVDEDDPLSDLLVRNDKGNDVQVSTAKNALTLTPVSVVAAILASIHYATVVALCTTVCYERAIYMANFDALEVDTERDGQPRHIQLFQSATLKQLKESYENGTNANSSVLCLALYLFKQESMRSAPPAQAQMYRRPSSDGTSTCTLSIGNCQVEIPDDFLRTCGDAHYLPLRNLFKRLKVENDPKAKSFLVEFYNPKSDWFPVQIEGRALIVDRSKQTNKWDELKKIIIPVAEDDWRYTMDVIKELQMNTLICLNLFASSQMRMTSLASLVASPPLSRFSVQSGEANLCAVQSGLGPTFSFRGFSAKQGEVFASGMIHPSEAKLLLLVGECRADILSKGDAGSQYKAQCDFSVFLTQQDKAFIFKDINVTSLGSLSRELWSVCGSTPDNVVHMRHIHIAVKYVEAVTRIKWYLETFDKDHHVHSKAAEILMVLHRSNNELASIATLAGMAFTSSQSVGNVYAAKDGKSDHRNSSEADLQRAILCLLNLDREVGFEKYFRPDSAVAPSIMSNVSITASLTPSSSPQVRQDATTPSSSGFTTAAQFTPVSEEFVASQSSLYGFFSASGFTTSTTAATVAAAAPTPFTPVSEELSLKGFSAGSLGSQASQFSVSEGSSIPSQLSLSQSFPVARLKFETVPMQQQQQQQQPFHNSSDTVPLISPTSSVISPVQDRQTDHELAAGMLSAYDVSKETAASIQRFASDIVEQEKGRSFAHDSFRPKADVTSYVHGKHLQMIYFGGKSSFKPRNDSLPLVTAIISQMIQFSFTASRERRMTVLAVNSTCGSGKTGSVVAALLPHLRQSSVAILIAPYVSMCADHKKEIENHCGRQIHVENLSGGAALTAPFPVLADLESRAEAGASKLLLMCPETFSARVDQIEGLCDGAMGARNGFAIIVDEAHNCFSFRSETYKRVAKCIKRIAVPTVLVSGTYSLAVAAWWKNTWQLVALPWQISAQATMVGRVACSFISLRDRYSEWLAAIVLPGILRENVLVEGSMALVFCVTRDDALRLTQEVRKMLESDTNHSNHWVVFALMGQQDDSSGEPAKAVVDGIATSIRQGKRVIVVSTVVGKEGLNFPNVKFVVVSDYILDGGWSDLVQICARASRTPLNVGEALPQALVAVGQGLRPSKTKTNEALSGDTDALDAFERLHQREQVIRAVEKWEGCWTRLIDTEMGLGGNRGCDHCVRCREQQWKHSWCLSEVQSITSSGQLRRAATGSVIKPDTAASGVYLASPLTFSAPGRMQNAPPFLTFTSEGMRGSLMPATSASSKTGGNKSALTIGSSASDSVKFIQARPLLTVPKPDFAMTSPPLSKRQKEMDETKVSSHDDTMGIPIFALSADKVSSRLWNFDRRCSDKCFFCGTSAAQCYPNKCQVLLRDPSQSAGKSKEDFFSGCHGCLSRLHNARDIDTQRREYVRGNTNSEFEAKGYHCCFWLARQTKNVCGDCYMHKQGDSKKCQDFPHFRDPKGLSPARRVAFWTFCTSSGRKWFLDIIQEANTWQHSRSSEFASVNAQILLGSWDAFFEWLMDNHAEKLRTLVLAYLVSKQY